jgi:hypothetical protein
MAFADDVTIFISVVIDLAIIEEALQQFESSWACINSRKSKAIAVGVGVHKRPLEE